MHEINQDSDVFLLPQPHREVRSQRPSPRPSPGGRGRIGAAGLDDWSLMFAGASRDGSVGWDSMRSPGFIRGSLSLRERAWGEGGPLNPRDRLR
jgi:hypothetical protein